jgi:hypothetical protein
MLGVRGRQVTMATITTNDAIVLARARIRIIRAEIELNHIITAAREDNIQAIQEIVGWVERRLSRAAFRDILTLIPELRSVYSTESDTDSDIENNNNPDDDPANDPLPPPPPLRRQ